MMLHVFGGAGSPGPRDAMTNNLQAVWTDQVGFAEGVEQTLALCQEILDKEPA